MSRQWGRHVRRCIAAVLVSLCWATTAVAQQIWFAPWLNPHNPQAYMALFQPNAPWPRAAAAVKVFEVAAEAIYKPSSGVDAPQIFAFLNSHHIGLEVGFSPLTGGKPGGPGSCGFNVEGYGSPGGPLSVALVVKKLGGDPIYFGMDEPLYFGHVFTGDRGRVACRSPIADLARDVANKVRQMRGVFPNVRFGDVEPLTFSDNDPWSSSGAWLADLSAWLDEYQAAVGEKLAFMRIETWWTPRLATEMPALTKLLHDKGVPLQFIYNGTGQKTDKEWIASAVSHFKALETGNWPRPDVAVFQFWTPVPSRLLPETDPTTATGMINQYLDWQQTRPHR